MNNYEALKENDRSIWWNRLDIDNRFYFDGVPIIDWFFDDYRFLSNYHIQPIVYNGKVYQSTEHAYQAHKTLIEEIHEDIRNASSPGKAKKLGGAVTLRPDWEQIKEQIMREIVWLKFNADANLAGKLLRTGDAYLIEGTVWHDNVWGICIKKNCEKGCEHKRATNFLGKILMETRKTLKSYVESGLMKEVKMAMENGNK